jgi:uncharacterized protein (TIRG00374 family)
MSVMNSDPLDHASAAGLGQRWYPRHTASLMSVVASGVLLFLLYRRLDIRLIGEALLRADRFWLVISVGIILPITVLRAFRFYSVAPAGALPGIPEALRLTLAASALNLVLPAKSGDLIKSYFVATRGKTSTGVAIAIIMYERLCDLFGLLSWGLLGWLIGRPLIPGLPSAIWLLLGVFWIVCAGLISSERAAALLRTLLARVLPHGKFRKLHDLADGWPDLLRVLRGRRRWIVSLSLVIWLTHLFQMWMFTVALSVSVPVAIFVSLVSLALMAGQIPMTVAGLGTRDVALVLLLSRYMPSESAAALGVLVATRNLVPPLVGIPMMGRYLSSVVGEARRWRRESARAE